MSDLTNIISQLKQQESSIDRAIEALREITGSSPSRDASTSVSKKTNGKEPKRTKAERPLKGRPLTDEQKRAISNAWTPERKQKFAEFHVQRMARARGEDPAKALQEYRRRKQKQHGGASAARQTAAKPVPRKAAAKKSVTKVATDTPAAS